MNAAIKYFFFFIKKLCFCYCKGNEEYSIEALHDGILETRRTACTSSLFK